MVFIHATTYNGLYTPFRPPVPPFPTRPSRHPRSRQHEVPPKSRSSSTPPSAQSPAVLLLRNTRPATILVRAIRVVALIPTLPYIRFLPSDCRVCSQAGARMRPREGDMRDTRVGICCSNRVFSNVDKSKRRKTHTYQQQWPAAIHQKFGLMKYTVKYQIERHSPFTSGVGRAMVEFCVQSSERKKTDEATKKDADSELADTADDGTMALRWRNTQAQPQGMAEVTKAGGGRRGGEGEGACWRGKDGAMTQCVDGVDQTQEAGGNVRSHTDLLRP
ncbi:hypothetical protein R3P38DRAFT_2796191 [Favolaschia claudopus]|uniref:Uncharacterized protein n=1 Tax=Favolaschia claudopus TaxID=2862362 RepID=A0AAW0A4V6_9AGAR